MVIVWKKTEHKHKSAIQRLDSPDVDTVGQVIVARIEESIVQRKKKDIKLRQYSAIAWRVEMPIAFDFLEGQHFGVRLNTLILT